jgi:hypothetical protein
VLLFFGDRALPGGAVPGTSTAWTTVCTKDHGFDSIPPRRDSEIANCILMYVWSRED